MSSALRSASSGAPCPGRPRRRLGQGRIGEQALGVERADFRGRRRPDPDRLDARLRKQPLRAAAASERRQKRADALLARAPRAPAPMLERLDVVGQVGVNDDADIGQIDAARGDVGRDQHARRPLRSACMA